MVIKSSLSLVLSLQHDRRFIALFMLFPVLILSSIRILHFSDDLLEVIKVWGDVELISAKTSSM